jgi:hypothetical protein
MTTQNFAQWRAANPNTPSMYFNSAVGSTTPATPNRSTLEGINAGNMDGTLTRDEINAAFNNLFGRDAAQAGLDYWGSQSNVNEGNLYSMLRNHSSATDRVAADYLTQQMTQQGTFNTNLGHTWADPTVKRTALESYGVGNQLNWNAQTNRWEYSTPQAPVTPAPVTPAPVTPAPVAPIVAPPPLTAPAPYAPPASSGSIGAAPAPTQQYTPDFNRQVTDPEVVEKRVAAMMRDGHPLLEQARQKAMEQFAGRGLLNSSFAIQAAQEAMLEQAYQIASADAQTYSRQGLANQGFQNEFAGREQVQNYTRENQFNDFNYKGQLMDRDYGHQAGMMDRDYGYKGQMMDREYDYRGQLMGMENSYQQDNTRLEYGLRGDFLGLENGYQQDNMRLQNGYQQDNTRLEYGLRGDLLERELAARNDYDQTTAQRNEGINARGNYANAMSQLQRDYQREYAMVTQNADIAPEEQTKFVDNLNARYRILYEDMNALYEAMPVWQEAWSVAWGGAATTEEVAENV